MAGEDEVYGAARAGHLAELLRSIAQRIQALDRRGDLLGHAPELIALLGDARSELFHYEVRHTYDPPEAAAHRRLVEEASAPPDFSTPDDEEEEPWRNPPDR